MRKLGFTLIELIVVIAIVLLLMAITVAIIGQVKERAQVTDEIQRLRQIYLAVNLYENDYDSQSPESLLVVAPQYLPVASLASPHDERQKRTMVDWPVNPWVYLPGFDADKYRLPRMKTLNSFFYLKTFETRFPEGRTYAEYRGRSEVGMITSAGLLKCGECIGPKCIGSCEYWDRASDPARIGHPAANLYGTVATIRMDGSYWQRIMPERCGAGHWGHSVLFFNPNLDDCGPIAVTPTSQP